LGSGVGLEKVTFETESEDLFAKRLATLAIKIAAPVNFLYCFYDLFFNEIHQVWFVGTRIFVSIITIILWRNPSRFLSKSNIYLSGYVFGLLYSVSISALGFLAGRNGLLYFHDGHLHVLFGVLIFLPWNRYQQLLVSFIWIYAGMIPFRIMSGVPITSQEVVTKTGFDIFVIILAIYNANKNRESRLNEYLTRQTLNEQVQSRERLIDEKVRDIMTATDQIRRKDAELIATQQLSDLAAQVAHDIRSPLTALGIVTADIEMIPQDRRRLVQTAVARINDIANSLLNFRKKPIDKMHVQISQIMPIGALIDRMVSEKRIENSNWPNVRINYQETPDVFAAFVNLPPHDLERHFSNILNNAIESIPEKGEVNVSVQRSSGGIGIKVEDNGIGMSAEVLEKVSSKGFSTKSSGHGLGLFHVKEFLIRFAGSLEIESKIGKGTSVLMNLPIAEPPKWCLDKLNISNFNHIVIVDDDAPILEVWQKRFKRSATELTYISDPNEFEKRKFNNLSTLFLIDYEFRHSTTTGLDLINQYKLSNSAVLVTSRFEDQDVIKGAEDVSVKILPKNWIPIVPLE